MCSSHYLQLVICCAHLSEVIRFEAKPSAEYSRILYSVVVAITFLFRVFGSAGLTFGTRGSYLPARGRLSRLKREGGVGGIER